MIIGIDLGHECKHLIPSPPWVVVIFLVLDSTHSTNLFFNISHYLGTKIAASFPLTDSVRSPPVPFVWRDNKSAHALPTIVVCQDLDGRDDSAPGDAEPRILRWFKLKALCSETRERTDGSEQGLSRKQARSLVRQFLDGLLPRISAYFDDRIRPLNTKLPPWTSARIEFVFSVPSIVGQEGAAFLEQAAKEAGFSTSDGKHRVLKIAFTEAEAAAIHVVKEFKDLLKVRHSPLHQEHCPASEFHRVAHQTKCHSPGLPYLYWTLAAEHR